MDLCRLCQLCLPVGIVPGFMTIMERLFEYEEAGRARYLRYKAEHSEENAEGDED